MSRKRTNIDKYDYYLNSVQSPDVDVEFLSKTYKKLRKKAATSLREDFCGTFALCCEWVKDQKHHQAFGVDLDPEPIEYGKRHYLPELKAEQQKRIKIMRSNVLGSRLPHSDIICALNFSYFIFKQRATLKRYLKNCLKTLNKDGMLVLDVFGGPACHAANEEKMRKKGFMYFWEQQSWDPIKHEAQFAIHFQPKGQRKIESVFTYDWRMWTIPEIREILAEVGFSQSVVFWEGTNRKGEGNGVFKVSENASDDECESWIAYIVALK